MDEYLRGYEQGYKDAIETMKRMLSKTEKSEKSETTVVRRVCSDEHSL